MSSNIVSVASIDKQVALVQYNVNMLAAICDFLKLDDIVCSLQFVCKYYHLHFNFNRELKDFIVIKINKEYPNLSKIFEIKQQPGIKDKKANKKPQGDQNCSEAKGSEERKSILQQITPVFVDWKCLTSILLNKIPNIRQIVKIYDENNNHYINGLYNDNKYIPSNRIFTLKDHMSAIEKNMYNFTYLMHLGDSNLIIHWLQKLLTIKNTSNDHDGEVSLLFQHISDRTSMECRKEIYKKIDINMKQLQSNNNNNNKNKNNKNNNDDHVNDNRKTNRSSLKESTNWNLSMFNILSNNEELRNALISIVGLTLTHDEYIKLFDWLLNVLTKNNRQVYHENPSMFFELICCENEKSVEMETKIDHDTTNSNNRNGNNNNNNNDGLVVIKFSKIKLLSKLWKLINDKYCDTFLVEKEAVPYLLHVLFGSVGFICRNFEVDLPQPFIRQNVRYNREILYRLQCLKLILMDGNLDYGISVKSLFFNMNQYMVNVCEKHNLMDIYNETMNKGYCHFNDHRFGPHIFDIIFYASGLSTGNINDNGGSKNRYIVTENDLKNNEKALLGYTADVLTGRLSETKE